MFSQFLSHDICYGFNKFLHPVAKYKSSSLGELLDLLVFHQLRLNELLTYGQFRNKKYLRHRRSVSRIQDAIRSITQEVNDEGTNKKSN